MGGEDWRIFFQVVQRTGAMEATTFVIFVAFIQIALMNMLTGVFVENAMKLAQPDRDALAFQYRRQMLQDAENLKTIFTELDKSGKGIISLKDFEEALYTSHMMAHLSVLDLDVKDAEAFFLVLASASERAEVDINTFVEGCLRLRGAATSIDVQQLVAQNREIQRNLYQIQQEFCDRLAMIWKELPAKLCFSAHPEARTGEFNDSAP